jgi:hypothetical protein
MGLVVVVGLSLLVWNIISHATHRTSVTPVATVVRSVSAVDDSHVMVVAEVTSRATTAATVNCLVGIERPATPLAYPVRVTRTLAPGQSATITIERSLLKPQAKFVTTADVAFTCT